MVYDITVQNSDLNAQYDKFMEGLDAFYELNWTENKPNIFVLSNKEDVRKCREHMGLRESGTITGWIGSGSVYVVSKELYSEIMNPLDLEDQYRMLIIHELSHLFYQHVSGFQTRPDWLWEGCAIYLSGQNKYKMRPETFSNFLEYYEKNRGSGVYQESGFVIELLINHFGKDKLLNLIKRVKDVKTEQDFNHLFQEIYGIELNYTALNELWTSR